jgi:hypothetical protein
MISRNVIELRGVKFKDAFEWGGSLYYHILTSLSTHEYADIEEYDELGHIPTSWGDVGTADVLYPFTPADVYVVDGVVCGWITLMCQNTGSDGTAYITPSVDIVKIMDDGSEEVEGGFICHQHIFDFGGSGSITVAFPYWINISAMRVEQGERIALRITAEGYATHNAFDLYVVMRRNSKDVMVRMPIV